MFILQISHILFNVRVNDPHLHCRSRIALWSRIAHPVIFGSLIDDYEVRNMLSFRPRFYPRRPQCTLCALLHRRSQLKSMGLGSSQGNLGSLGSQGLLGVDRGYSESTLW